MKIVLSVLIICLSAFSQNKRPITPDDLWVMKRVANLTVSPDGKYGCFVVTEFSVKENKGNSDLWMIDLSNSKIKRLTTNLGSDAAPSWSPNNRTIAFVSKREGDFPQLYTIDIDGGEASLVCEMPMGVSSPRFLGDGKRIAFVSAILPEYEKDIDAMKKALKEKKDNKVTAKVTENRSYRYWDSFLTDGYVNHLFTYSIETKTRIDLTEGSKRMTSVDGSASYDISPDGQWVAMGFNSTEPPYKDINNDIFLFKSDDFVNAVNITTDNDDEDFSPLFSRDGKFLYYGRTTEKNHPDNANVVKYDLAGKTSKVISEGKDLSFGGFTESLSGKEIYFMAEENARAAIYSSKLEKMINEGAIQSLNVGADKLWFIKSDMTSPGEIFEWNIKSKKLTALSSFNKSILDSLTLTKPLDITFKGADNDNVQMYLLYPPNFDAAKKYPLIHMVHGGPAGTFGDDWSYRWNAQVFASYGYVVAMVNFHGSTSFGKKFMTSIVGAHGDKPFTDMMRATDYLIRTYPFVDSMRMAAAGGSYGGYLVNWIAGHTDRFKCLISHAGVYNLMGQFASDVTSDRVINYDGAPWQGRYEQINKWSPAFYAENFKTPMLIIHGEKDYRVVVTQGLELYGVLTGKGVPARLVYFPNENHWILQPQNSIYWNKEVKDWFAKYLK